MNYQEAMRKAAACLRLAERGGTPEEAAQAAAMAQQIITKYQLDVNSIDFDRNRATEDKEEIKNFGYEDPLDCPTAGQFSKEMIQLARIVANFNSAFVSYRKMSTYNIQMRIVGRPSDVSTVRYLYGFYKNQILEMVSRCCKGNSHTYKGQFCLGVVNAISDKLTDQQKKTFEEVRTEQANNPLALVRVNGAIQRLEKKKQDVVAFELAYKKQNGIGTGRGYSGSRTETGGFGHGKREGQNIRTSGAKASISSGRKCLP